MPRYLQLHALLREQILSGQFVEGSLLPSENQLSSQHQITRSMVRQALNELEKDGLIRKQRGKGSIVERKDQRLGLLSFRGFTEALSGSDLKVTSHFLQPVSQAAWGESFFFDLSEAEKERGCINIQRLREVDRQPVMVERTYFADVLPGFVDQTWIEASLFKTLQQHYKIRMQSVEQYLRAIVADTHLADHFGLSEATPLLKINRKYATSQVGFYVYSTLFCNTENYAIGSYLE